MQEVAPSSEEGLQEGEGGVRGVFEGGPLSGVAASSAVVPQAVAVEALEVEVLQEVAWLAAVLSVALALAAVASLLQDMMASYKIGCTSFTSKPSFFPRKCANLNMCFAFQSRM